MGLQNSKQDARLAELQSLMLSTYEVACRLEAARNTDAERAAAAGLPAASEFDQALYDAIYEHNLRLLAEYSAILHHQFGTPDGRSVPMPAPTPFFNLTPPPVPQARDTPAPVAGPGTPVGGDGSRRGQRGASSGSGGGVQGSSETVPLLGGGPGRLAPGLRQRHGRGEES